MRLSLLQSTALPPGPLGLDSLRYMRRLQLNPLVTLRELADHYGDLVYLSAGPYRIYLLNHPDYLHELLVRQAHLMHKPKSLSRPIADFLGNGLLISHGDYWRQQRRIIQPAFHHRQVQVYADEMVHCILCHSDAWTEQATLDIDHEFMKITLEMVTRTLFSSAVTARGDEVAEAVKLLQHVSYHQGQSAIPIPTWIPLPQHLSKQRAIQLLDDVVLQIIRARRSEANEPGDLLSMLLDARTEQGDALTEDQIRDEVMTVLLAGHESTANAIAWMWYLLAQHDPVQDKLQQELDRVLADRPPTFEDLKALPYSAMIVKEALRLYPPAWALPREPVEDTEIGGYRVKKGSLVLGVPFLIQRDSRHYARPDDFIPERFAENAEKRLSPMVYIPFGGGPRFCVGNTFALMAMQLSLVTIQQRFRLRLLDQEVVLDPLLTLRPRYGLHMQVERVQ